MEASFLPGSLGLICTDWVIVQDVDVKASTASSQYLAKANKGGGVDNALVQSVSLNVTTQAPK